MELVELREGGGEREPTNTPLRRRGIKGILRNLEPRQPRRRRRRCIVHLGQVRHDRALVARSNRVLLVARPLGAPDDVLEPDADVVARVGSNNDCGRGAPGRAAGDGAAGHVGHGVVGWGDAEGGEGGLGYVVDGEFLGMGVSVMHGLCLWDVGLALSRLLYLEKAVSLDGCAECDGG